MRFYIVKLQGVGKTEEGIDLTDDRHFILVVTIFIFSLTTYIFISLT